MNIILMNLLNLEMNTGDKMEKKHEPDNIFCICGKKAKGLKRKDYYLVICDSCKKKYRFDSKKLYQETIYTMFIKAKPKPVKLMTVCGICKESMYHNYKYQFCTKCRIVKYIYK